MKILTYIAFSVVFLVVMLIGVGFLLPAKTHIERAAYIEASPRVVYPLISNFREFNKWSSWARIDTATQYRFEGPTQGLGAIMHWSSEHSDVGQGRQQIIDAQPDRKVRVLLDFGPRGTAVASYKLDELEDGTHIIWAFDTEHGNNILSRYFGLLMDRWLGKQYEQGLHNLKRLAESLPTIANPQVVTEEITYDVGGTNYLGYLAFDNQAEKRPGILLIHDHWGHTDFIRKRAELLAELGFTAFALDLFGADRQVKKSADAESLSNTILATTDVNQEVFLTAFNILKKHPTVNTNQLAAIGYGLGGTVLFQMLNSGVAFDAAVSFYGNLPENISANKIKSSILILNAGNDTQVKHEKLQAFFRQMDNAGVDYEFKDYPNAERGFANPQSNQYAIDFSVPLAYSKAADEDSWQTVRAFLARVIQ